MSEKTVTLYYCDLCGDELRGDGAVLPFTLNVGIPASKPSMSFGFEWEPCQKDHGASRAGDACPNCAARLEAASRGISETLRELDMKRAEREKA